METKNVKIGQDVYRLTAVTADISGAVSIELLTDFAPLITSLLDGNIELFNQEIRITGNREKLMRIIQELINFPILEKNGDIVLDWKEEFQRKPLTLFKLGYEALRFNCEDFFTFISGSLNVKQAGKSLQETIKNLQKDGAEIPPLFALLLQSGEPEKDLKTQE